MPAAEFGRTVVNWLRRGKAVAPAARGPLVQAGRAAGEAAEKSESFLEMTKAQFRPKSWMDVGRAVGDAVKDPKGVAREGLKKNYGDALGKVSLGLIGLEGYNMAAGAIGPRGEKRKFLNREFGEGAADSYGKMRKERDRALYGTTSQRVGMLAAGEVAGTLAAAKKIRFLPGMALMMAAGSVGRRLGGGLDRLRGVRKSNPADDALAIQRYSAANALIKARKKALKSQATPTG